MYSFGRNFYVDFFKFDFLKTVKSPDQRKAWFVAILADAIQIVGMPLFAEGGLSPLDTGLDVIVGAILIKLLGWHWAFLPTFAAELVPDSIFSPPGPQPCSLPHVS